LAFYFGKEQLEAANRTVESPAGQPTSEDKVRSIKVTEKMIPRSDAFIVTQEPGDMKLLDKLDSLVNSRRGTEYQSLRHKASRAMWCTAVPSIIYCQTSNGRGDYR
jgi:hypothetical protein